MSTYDIAVGCVSNSVQMTITKDGVVTKMNLDADSADKLADLLMLNAHRVRDEEVRRVVESKKANK